MSTPQAQAQVTLSLPILRRGQHAGEPPVERLQFMLNFVKGADDLLAQLGGPEVAAALAGERTGEVVLSIHVASDEEVDAALQAAVGAGGVMVKEAAATPLGGSYGFFADPDGHVWEVIHHPLYRLGADGRPEVP